jgi:hypothetical protein
MSENPHSRTCNDTHRVVLCAGSMAQGLLYLYGALEMRGNALHMPVIRERRIVLPGRQALP